MDWVFLYGKIVVVVLSDKVDGPAASLLLLLIVIDRFRRGKDLDMSSSGVLQVRGVVSFRGVLWLFVTWLFAWRYVCTFGKMGCCEQRRFWNLLNTSGPCGAHFG